MYTFEYIAVNFYLERRNCDNIKTDRELLKQKEDGRSRMQKLPKGINTPSIQAWGVGGGGGGGASLYC